MPGSVLENLSGKKLAVLVVLFLICQIICFLIGGLIAPKPSSTDTILATKCLDKTNNTAEWFYIRGENKCSTMNINVFSYEKYERIANQIVFSFQMPTPRDNIILDYSRWQQNLIGILQLDISYHPENEMKNRTVLTIDAKLGYRNQGDKDDDWKYYASSVEQRNLDCILEHKKDGYPYNCSFIPLFELGSLHHDFYLLNIRLPVDNEKGMNLELGKVDDMWLVAINQTGGFTKVWMSLKSIFFPFIVGILIWFWKRVHGLQRKPLLLEYMLLFLGTALTFLNLPLELLTLFYELPFMLLLADIRQGIFYAALLSFWLIFAAEHLMVRETQENQFKTYWKHLSGVAIGCIALFIFDLCERGVQLRNPFYSIWVTDIGTKIAMGFLIVGGISVGVYFLVLCWLIWQVFCNMRAKRANLPVMSQARRLHYSGIIYRFNFLMLTTLICAALTLIAFTLGQVSEGQWKWDEHQYLEYTSAFFTGVYGMWNIYIFALIILYAPSHKQWPSQIGILFFIY
ncbi:hypothetical protein AAG570_007886 [Ranatra chinensis]|uniref:Protein wntless n=1 Tax=Ranatra chinensis TaxID=642074 RepID=A0ABD0XV44_9HEMI